MRSPQRVQVLALSSVLSLMAGPERAHADTARAENRTVGTLCAEHDNVNVALVPSRPGLSITSFEIAATHPTYPFDSDHGQEDFTNCPPPTHADTFYSNPGTFVIHDDGWTVVIGVRLGRWWRPRAMTASGARGRFDDIHYIAVHREIDGRYPQVLVLYSDGNLRLKPLPPVERFDTLFGSSVVLGPAPFSDRPFVSIDSVEYRPERESFDIRYESGESAVLAFDEVSRSTTRVRAEPGYATPPGVAFLTFRSMYVREGNTDVDHVVSTRSDVVRDDPIMEFSSAEADEFFFTRHIHSRHNTSAPDIRIGAFVFGDESFDFDRGDVDQNGRFDLTDGIAALDVLFTGARAPSCADALDFDDNGSIDLGDPLLMLWTLFESDILPPPPFGACGRDPSPDDLGCAALSPSCS
jgi:hypothetical protein